MIQLYKPFLQMFESLTVSSWHLCELNCRAVTCCAFMTRLQYMMLVFGRGLLLEFREARWPLLDKSDQP